eukprot:gb/GFBE01016463.1/.p1 GENE.gb/GFBE01016463.1/~~gb/GFBE01016463.1/.p1  ORF type:complete len:374 (+),score=85.61 gb/GFBE01016463.1/:1-1122(+)
MTDDVPTASVAAGAAMVTNSIRVRFPKAEKEGIPVSISEAFEELAPFGEIMRLELLPGQPGYVVLSYYNSRCAVYAAQELGLDRCIPDAQYGRSRISLPGTAQLPHTVLDQVFAVERDIDDDKYVLDFFDVRVAESFAQEHGGADEPVLQKRKMPKAHAKAYVAPCGKPRGELPSAPRYRNDLRLSEVVWSDLSSGSEARTTLRISGLPTRLCNEQAFHNLLDKAGLSECFDIVRVFTGGKGNYGMALVNATSARNVAEVAKFFHGRQWPQWGRSIPAAVSFAVTQGFAEVQRQYPSKGQLDLLSIKDSKMKAAPQRVEATESISGLRELHCASEISTEAGDELENSLGLEVRSEGASYKEVLAMTVTLPAGL